MDTRIWRRLHWTTWCAVAVVTVASVQCQLTAKLFSPVLYAPDLSAGLSFGWPCAAVVQTRHFEFVDSDLIFVLTKPPASNLKPVVMVFNLVVCLAALASVACVLEARRRHGAWRQFSLRGMLALVYASSIVLASYQFIGRDYAKGPELGWAFFADSDCCLRQRAQLLPDMDVVVSLWFDVVLRWRWYWLPMFFAIACTHYATGLLILKAIERLAGRLSLTPSRSRPSGGD